MKSHQFCACSQLTDHSRLYAVRTGTQTTSLSRLISKLQSKHLKTNISVLKRKKLNNDRTR